MVSTGLAGRFASCSSLKDGRRVVREGPSESKKWVGWCGGACAVLKGSTTGGREKANNTPFKQARKVTGATVYSCGSEEELWRARALGFSIV